MRKLFEMLGLVSAVVMVICTAYQLGLWAILPILLYPLGLGVTLANPKHRADILETADELADTIKQLKENF